MSDVSIIYKGSPIATMDASGTKTLLTESKYLEDDIEVVYTKPSGGQFKSGTYTPAQDYTGTAKREIVSLETIGFTPTLFIFRCSDKPAINGRQYAVFYALFDSRWPVRLQGHYTNTSNTSTSNIAQSSWTTETNYQLYCDGTKIYFKTVGSTAYLIGGAEYTWEAYA